MTAKYDVEIFLDEIESHLKSYLNTKLAEIDSEKDDGITLDTINSNAYVVQSMGENVVNYDPFVFIGISSLSGNASGPVVAQEVTAEIDVIMFDKQDKNSITKLWRYQRALTEVVNDYYFRILRTRGKLVVTGLTPVSLTAMNDDRPYKAIGIEIQTDIIN